MRLVIISLLAFILTIAALGACNSRDTVGSQISSPNPQSSPSQPNPADNARRIAAVDLHELWEKGNVLIIDTRTEPAYKEGHIKGAILIPAGEVSAKVGELPRDRMIVAYCT